MGKIGKCCCAEAECCICDEAWEFDNWSVNVLGKTFSGAFSPSVKPDPFTPENGCQSRMGDDCIVDSPTILLDCVQESEWGSRAFVPMSATGFFGSVLCYATCPQCFCNDTTGMQFDEACLKEGLVNWETESKGVTHSRAWQQEAFYGVAQILCCDTPANSVRFSFDLYYHVSRFAAQSSQGFRRFRSVTYDCDYAPGQTVVTPTLVYGSWIEPVSPGSKPPCLPCDWPQSDFFGNCPTLDSNCSPCPDYFGCPDESVNYTMEWIAITCQFIGFEDLDDDNICPIIDIDDSGNRFIYYGSTTMNAYVGSNTQYCSDAIYGFGTCDIGPSSAVIEHRFISDCIPCDEVPCNVTLNRVTGANLGEAITECVGGADADCNCGTISAICKTIPASIELMLTPCAGSTTVTPEPSSLLLTEFAPNANIPIAITVGTSALAITGFSPTVVDSVRLEPTAGTLALATFAPDLALPVVVVIPTESLVVTTYNASLNESIEVVAGTESLSLTTFAADLALPVVVVIPAESLVVTTYNAESVFLVVEIPETVATILSFFAPNVIIPSVAIPITASLNIVGYASTIETPIVVTPDVVALLLTMFSPTVIIDGGGCDCEPAVGVGGDIGEIQTTACTAECTGGECTYIWNGSVWVETDRTCF